MGAAKDPNTGLVHRRDRVDTLGGTQLDRVQHVRIRDRIAVKFDDLKTMTRKRHPMRLSRARVDDAKAHALTAFHAYRISGTERLAVDRVRGVGRIVH